MRKLLCALLPFASAAAFAATDVYVAKDGDDANDGLTRATAKATIPAGYAVLTNGTPEVTYGNRLIVGDGEWTSVEIGSTIVLSNGWSLVGENGRAATVFKVSAAGFVFFSQKSSDTLVRGITFDYNRGGGIDYKVEAINNPKGTIADCEFKNFYSTCTWGSSGMFRIGFNSVTCAPVITNCVFRNNCNVYNGACCIRTDVGAKNLLIVGCSFIDNQSGTSSHNASGTLHFYRAVGTMRNCLVLRSVVYGSGAAANVIAVGTSSANMVVENCTVADCKITGFADAGAIGLSGGANSGYTAKLAAKNCLAWGNTNTTAGAYVNLVTNTFTRATIAFSNCASDYAPEGDGNVVLTSANFTWQCTAEDRYIPTSGPSVDAGATLGWMGGAVDIRGKARVNGAAPDIGCFEYHEPNKYYVAKDGDDTNDGLTRATAKATLAAGLALLSDVDETLFIGDGEWTASSTMALSNGWAMVGENGRDMVTIKPASRITLFSLTSAGAAVRDVTIDFSGFNYNAHGTGALAVNPCGRFAGCVVKNYATYNGATGGNALVKIGNSAVECDFVSCLFENCSVQYRSAVFYIAHGKADFRDCSFVDCMGIAKAGTKYFNRGMIYCEDSSSMFRNCLFLRCGVYDSGSDTVGKANVVNFYNKSGGIVENCTFIDCGISGDGTGGAVGVINSTGNGGVVRNTLACGCTNIFGAANLKVGEMTYSHCASDELLAGDGNIVVGAGDIKFRRPSKGDYSVKRGPTIDAGETLSWHSGAKDLFGRDRVIGVAPDIGAFEYDFDEKGAALMFR